MPFRLTVGKPRDELAGSRGNSGLEQRQAQRPPRSMRQPARLCPRGSTRQPPRELERLACCWHCRWSNCNCCIRLGLDDGAPQTIAFRSESARLRPTLRRQTQIFDSSLVLQNEVTETNESLLPHGGTLAPRAIARKGSTSTSTCGRKESPLRKQGMDTLPPKPAVHTAAQRSDTGPKNKAARRPMAPRGFPCRLGRPHIAGVASLYSNARGCQPGSTLARPALRGPGESVLIRHGVAPSEVTRKRRPAIDAEVRVFSWASEVSTKGGIDKAGRPVRC